MGKSNREGLTVDVEMSYHGDKPPLRGQMYVPSGEEGFLPTLSPLLCSLFVKHSVQILASPLFCTSNPGKSDFLDSSPPPLPQTTLPVFIKSISVLHASGYNFSREILEEVRTLPADGLLWKHLLGVLGEETWESWENEYMEMTAGQMVLGEQGRPSAQSCQHGQMFK